MLFSNADEGWKEHMKQVQETFPDGTPIQDWFYQDSAPSLEELGRVYWLTDHHIEAGDALQTARIQALIDAIHQQGGGVLAVPEGTFRTGALFFRPHVHLYLAPGSMLLGSDDIADYPVLDTRIEGESCAYFSALINADRCDGFTVLGSGVIDGNGMKSWKAFWLRRSWNPQCTNKDEQRPRLLYVSNSKNVTVSGVRMQNSAFWTSHYYRCDHLRILDCSFYSPFEPVRSPSTDAIDLDVCCDVLVKGCDIHVNDDGIALKGGKGPWADQQEENGGNERILIEDCHYRFCHGCLTLGSESIHCKNVILRRCAVDYASNLLWLKFRPDTPQHFEHIAVENMRGRVKNFLRVHRWTQFFDLKGRQEPPPSVAEHISLRRCEMECDVFCDAPEDLSDYSLTDFEVDDARVHCQQRGNAAWLQNNDCKKG